MTTGKHDIEQEKYSLLDKSKLLYKQKLENVTLQAIPNLQNFKVIRSATNKQHQPLTCGWALMAKKSNVQFSQQQKDFLTQKYDESETTGMKSDPVSVAQEMQILWDNNGDYVFDREQWLTSQQIKSFWSRLTRNRRKSSKQQTTVQKQEDDDEEDDRDDENDNDYNSFQLRQQAKTLLSAKEQQQQGQQTSSSFNTRKAKTENRFSQDLTNQQQQPSKRLSKK
ncbi:unnamed protein product [Didymodactylos carnosus]|uniref:Uncharacterized protein n=2 Tax=Didymodactylos carnosus TaxID=1234261 RepID=A0A8S2PY42_9BILA|nr:unnamed protein product [Didymodactylos carnosus]CAF4076781.1 unnamed protein product [Didymodactylos carnosus]